MKVYQLLILLLVIDCFSYLSATVVPVYQSQSVAVQGNDDLASGPRDRVIIERFNDDGPEGVIRPSTPQPNEQANSTDYNGADSLFSMIPVASKLCTIIVSLAGTGMLM